MGVYVSLENGTVSGEIVHQLTVLIWDKGCAVWSVKVNLHGCLCVTGEWDCVGRDCPLANCPNPGQAVLSVKISLHGCLCVTGEWDCVRRDCPLANCPNLGQAVLSVKISLHGCLFVTGEWDCVRRDCPPTNCPNPGQGMCCMECEGKLTGVFMCHWRMGLCQERLPTN